MARNQHAQHTRTAGQACDEPAVLVVGAGLTGLLLARELARHGLTCRVIDEARGRQTAPRAIILHARTLEVFDDLGIVDKVLAVGRRVHGVNLYTTQEAGRGADRVGYLGLEELESPYSFMLGIPQPETEHLLRGALHHQGGEILWEHEVTAGTIRGGPNPRRPDALQEIFAQDVCRMQGKIEALRKEEVSCPHLEAWLASTGVSPTGWS